MLVSHGVFHKNRCFYESVGVRWGPWVSAGVRGPCKSRVREFVSGIIVAIIQVCQYVKTDTWPNQSKTPCKSSILSDNFDNSQTGVSYGRTVAGGPNRNGTIYIYKASEFSIPVSPLNQI